MKNIKLPLGSTRNLGHDLSWMWGKEGGVVGLLVNESRLFQKGGENYIAKPTSISAKSREQLAGVCYSTEKPPGATLGFWWVLLYCVLRNIRLRTDLSHNLSQVQRRLTDQSQLSLTANTRISLSQGYQERKKKGENVFDWHHFVQHNAWE